MWWKLTRSMVIQVNMGSPWITYIFNDEGSSADIGKNDITPPKKKQRPKKQKKTPKICVLLFLCFFPGRFCFLFFPQKKQQQNMCFWFCYVVVLLFCFLIVCQDSVIGRVSSSSSTRIPTMFAPWKFTCSLLIQQFPTPKPLLCSRL